MLLMNLSMTEKPDAQRTQEVAQEVRRVMEQAKRETKMEEEVDKGSSSRFPSTPETGVSKMREEESDGMGGGKRKRASSM